VDEREVEMKLKKMKFKKGFTLIELMVVVAIIVLLASIIVPNYFKGLEKSKIGKATADVVLLRKSVDLFRADLENNGNLPGTLGELFDKRYLSKEVPADPWGGSYVYISTANSYTITDGSSKGVSETINF